MHQATKDQAIILITHYKRLLDYIPPDFVHIMLNGKIIHSGDKNLPHTLEKKGYSWLAQQPDNSKINVKLINNDAN